MKEEFENLCLRLLSTKHSWVTSRTVEHSYSSNAHFLSCHSQGVVTPHRSVQIGVKNMKCT